MTQAPESIGEGNLAFVEELYERYLEDPQTVSEEWRAFFAPLQREQRPGPLHPRQRPGSLFNPPGGLTAEGADGTALQLLQFRVNRLINAYRASGHRAATLDPLGRRTAPVPELDPGYHGLGAADMELPCQIRTLPGARPVREVLALLEATYCRNVAVEFTHIADAATREWLEERMEPCQNRTALDPAAQRRVLDRLTRAEVLEQFIQRKFLGAKSFSLEGGESLIPLLDLAMERASDHGVAEVVIGMAHRGRLNVLVNIMGKRASEILRAFEDKDPELFWGRGDVKYHLGHQCDYETASGKRLLLTLCFNPSHLEFVGPVVLGRARARQVQRDDREHRQVLPLVIHGDAAFAGQGVVQEMLNLSGLYGYRTGGALHVIVNNQIGFTTPPEQSRSGHYATDVARLLQAPIFHVNGEDPEAVVHVVRLAMDFRARFRQDAVIDLYCYRKHGHNEGDEPSFTQPLMYEEIRAKRSVREVYVDRLLALGGFTKEDADALARQHEQHLERELAEARAAGFKSQPARRTGRWARFHGGPESEAKAAGTAVPRERLRELFLAQLRLPETFHPHPKLARLFEARRQMALGEKPLDWAAGELLAYATLLTEGHPVRLSGQDSGRGTFSHRHAVLHDVEDGRSYVPLRELAAEQARFEVWDSPLSEVSVLGFDYGYSLDSPDTLTIWEAQFGDFCNVAQVIIDQFITSAEDKWDLLSGLTLFLPHGFEGQGPEHSSARLERFLQLCAEDNIQVVNLTTPAQIFHCLRRQVRRSWRKPLVVMTPKSLLRHPEAVSRLDELAEGEFQEVIPDDRSQGPVARVLLCSGKVYYDLEAYRREAEREDVAIVRVEQLYPLPRAELEQALAPYPDRTPVVWVQEEPFNMGAWYYLRARLEGGAFARLPLSCVSRAESASPATGSAASHKQEQRHLVLRAFGVEGERA